MGDCGDYKVRDTWTRLFPTKPFPQVDTLSAHELYSIGLFFSEYKLSYPVITGNKYIIGMFVYSKPISQTDYYIDPYFIVLIYDPHRNTYIHDDNSFNLALSSNWLGWLGPDSELTASIRQEFKCITEEWRTHHLADCVFCAESINDTIQCNKCNNCFAHKKCIDKWKEVSIGKDLVCPQCRVPIDHTHAWGLISASPVGRMNIESHPPYLSHPSYPSQPSHPLQLAPPKKDCNIM
jgi:hypothetical protein